MEINQQGGELESLLSLLRSEAVEDNINSKPLYPINQDTREDQIEEYDEGFRRMEIEDDWRVGCYLNYQDMRDRDMSVHEIAQETGSSIKSVESILDDIDGGVVDKLSAALKYAEQVTPFKLRIWEANFGRGFAPGHDRKAAIQSYLENRKKIGLAVSPETAEVKWLFADPRDPYFIDIDLKQEIQGVDMQFFAREPGSDVWVWFGDLPEAVAKALWDKHEGTFAYPAFDRIAGGSLSE